MFNDFEREQKEKAFNYSKLRFENMDAFLNEKQLTFRDEYTNYSYMFITIANFISYKEDIWVKNKKTKSIATNFSKEVLDKFVFEGKFKSAKIDFRDQRKQNDYSFTPIKINNILKGKEKDSIWIIDNVRDSIAHGHYFIDFNNNSIVINNLHEDRLLNCELKFDLFLGLNELVTEERIGGYTEKLLTTTPLLHRIHKTGAPIITNIEDSCKLKYLLKNSYIISYCQVNNIKENDNTKKYNDLVKFYNYNVRISENMHKTFNPATHVNLGEYYVKRMKSYVEDQMKNYDITIFSNHLDEETANKVIKYVDEQPKFYTRNIVDQGLILHEIIKSVISHEKITLERGITDIVELYNHCSLKQSITNPLQLNSLQDLIFGNVNAFKENKRLANLFILGTNNFVSNKESIYDKYFDDYNEFDLSKFEYQDYSGYDRLISKLKLQSENLNILNKSLNKVTNSKNKANDNLINAPTDKKAIIQNNINKLDILINELNNKINEATLEINSIMTNINTHKNDSYGNYINNNNKSFFNHLRNAFAHNNIKYLDDNPNYNRKIVLEDYDDDKKLSFRCVCRYYDLVKLFNNELFLDAIKNKETKKRKK